jgi:glutamate racemase
MPLIEETAGPGVAVIDTGIAVAREVARRLGDEGPGTSPKGCEGEDELFWTSGDPGEVGKVIGRLWGETGSGHCQVRALPEGS